MSQLNHHPPADILPGQSIGTEAEAAIAEARMVLPRLCGPVALVPVNSSYPVHTYIADLWQSRLPDHVVIAANTGLEAGVVHFSARTVTRTNLIDFLNRHAPIGASDQFVRGRGQASGGVLPYPAWNDFAAKLGYGSDAMVAPGPEPAGMAG